MKKKSSFPQTKVKNPEPKKKDENWIIWAAWADRITFEEIERRLSLSLKKVPAVGDTLRDLQAYKGIKAQPILVKTGNGEKTILDKKFPKNTLIFENLYHAAEFIIEKY